MEPNTSDLFPPIPTETANAAKIFFPPRNFYLTIGERANHLFAGIELENPFGWEQDPERNLAMLFLITIFQYIESIPDWQAEEALRSRVDWKYALHLGLNYPGINVSTLCAFRRWLLVEQSQHEILPMLVSRLSEILVDTNKRTGSFNSTEIVPGICLLNRVAIAIVAIRSVLEVLASSEPEWLQTVALPHWYIRYGVERKKMRFTGDRSELQVLSQQVRADMAHLLEIVSTSTNRAAENLPEISFLKLIWQTQHNSSLTTTGGGGEICAGCPFMP